MAFLTGQSWHVLKSWYTGGDPEQVFRHCFAHELNQRLISSSAQATLPYAQPHTQFFSPREWEWREKTLPVSKGSALGTRLPYVTVAFLAESSPLLSCASPLQVIPIERCCMWRSVKLNSRHRTFHTGSQNDSRESSVCKISIVVQVRYKFVFDVKNRFWWSEWEMYLGTRKVDAGACKGENPSSARKMCPWIIHSSTDYFHPWNWWISCSVGVEWGGRWPRSFVLSYKLGYILQWSSRHIGTRRR